MCQKCDSIKAFNFDDNQQKPPIISDDLSAAILLLLWDDNTHNTMSVIRREWDSKFTFNDKALNELMKQMARNHAQAAHLGRQRAGSNAPFGQSDLDFGKAIALQEKQYLEAMLKDIQANRYGPFDKDFNSKEVQAEIRKAEQRARLQSNKLIATANEAWVLTAGDKEKIYWNLSPFEEHCIDCPRIAAGSPYTKATLRQYPKDGQTQCITNCLCWLTTESGAKSFVPQPVKKKGEKP